MHTEINFSVEEHLTSDSGYMFKFLLFDSLPTTSFTFPYQYNYAHNRTRLIIEKTFIKWDSNFTCEIRMTPENVSNYNFCAALPNAALIWKQI